MTPTQQLAELVERLTGIVIPDRDRERLTAVAAERARTTGQVSLARYVRYLADGGDWDEWRALLGHITVNESSLFRGPAQLAGLARVVLPRLVAGGATEPLSVWSAGCARGEEAATLAIVLAEQLGPIGFRWRILATDLDENSLAAARSGRFGRRAVARVEQELRERYFRRVGTDFELVPELRDRITFRALNLMDEPVRPDEAPFHVVFLRNVLIYFRPAAQRRVVEAVASTLAPEGVLFVGPSESLWQLHTGLQPEDLGDCFCYRVPHGWSENGTAVQRVSETPDPVPTPPAPASPPPQRATGPEPTPEVPAMPAAAEVALGVADCLERGAHDDAMARATEAGRRSPDDPVLRAIEGRVHDLTGENERAIAAYRAALYIEPSLCEVRFLMAECLDRIGRHDRASRELRSVLAGLASQACTPVPAMDPLGRPSRDHMEWRAREILHQQG